MNSELERISKKLKRHLESAKEAIANAALEGDWERSKAITEAAKLIDSTNAELKIVSEKVAKALDAFDNAMRINAPSTKSPQKRLRVTIFWTRADFAKPNEILDEETAAETLVRFIESLVLVIGPQILPAIANVPNGASGLVSRAPETDFRNPNSNVLYAHAPLGPTGWFLKTHSSTKQKADQVRGVAAIAGLPSCAVEVEMIDKREGRDRSSPAMSVISVI